jgi:hypothetical protein
MNESPSNIGARAEVEVAAALTRVGKQVYLPLCTSHGRVDLIFADESGLHRVQCKTSRLIDDVISFSTCSNTGGLRKDYQGQVDYLGVYSPDLGQVFLLPIDDLPSRGCHLRLGPARNAQQKGVRWAADYLIGRFAPSR